MALDSDLNNPDAVLSVRFYKREMPNAWESEKQKKPVTYEADFVEIKIPGNTNTVIDTFAREEHIARFPVQWARFQNEQGAFNENMKGTSLEKWDFTTSTQTSELKRLNFYTVEQIANSSDENISKIGMLVGMSPIAFREKAKEYLNAEDAGKQAQQTGEIEALKAQIAQLTALVSGTAEAPRRGRPPVEKTDDGA